MKSPSQKQFAQIASADIPRSKFRCPHSIKTTFDSGYLIPFYVNPEVYPGDTINFNATLFARLATPINPIMDNMHMDVFYFAVPYRLVWDNFQKFMGEQKNPDDSIDFQIPQILSPVTTGWEVGSVADYFGLPTGIPGLSVSRLPFDALNSVKNEWFRDENLMDSYVVDTSDVTYQDVIDSNPTGKYKVTRRCKAHDYFTSALPWPQKGPEVMVPITGNATVRTSTTELITSNASKMMGRLTGGIRPGINSAIGHATDGSVYQSSTNVTGTGNYFYPTNLYADTENLVSVSVNDLRELFATQKLYERFARGGSRYTEIVRSHFRVVSPDARLQRPEYLGGASARVIVNPVMQTSSTDTTTPQGNLAAYGIVADSHNGFSKSFTEHTIIIGILNVRADLTYQQGIPKSFLKKDRFDFYWPAFAHLGEQAILNEEIFAQGTSADKDVFGYQERFSELRYCPSKITGKFRSTYSAPLDAWHLSQKFENLPVLNDEFIVDNPPVDRVIAVPSEPHFLLDSYIDMVMARPLPMYSTPGLIDHF